MSLYNVGYAPYRVTNHQNRMYVAVQVYDLLLHAVRHIRPFQQV